MTTMLALRAHDGAKTPLLESVPVPAPGPDDVVVEVAAAGLAPGMLLLLENGSFRHLPTTLGHEAAGTVSAVGSAVASVRPGSRVRVHPNLNCRDCAHCRGGRDMMCAQQAMLGHAAFGSAPMPLYERYHDGGLANYVRVPHWLVDPLPDGVSFDVGAKVHDLANAVRAFKCADLPPAATVVVTAATGGMGAAAVRLAAHFGVARLILVGRDTGRLKAVAALSNGIPADIVATAGLQPDWAATAELTSQLRQLAVGGAHAVLDFVPQGPMTGQAFMALATGGTLVHMGGNGTPLTLPPAALLGGCLRLVGTRACTREDAAEVLRWLAAGTLVADDLITHRFPLTDAVKALAALRNRTSPMWMTVVHP